MTIGRKLNYILYTLLFILYIFFLLKYKAEIQEDEEKKLSTFAFAQAQPLCKRHNGSITIVPMLAAWLYVMLVLWCWCCCCIWCFFCTLSAWIDVEKHFFVCQKVNNHTRKIILCFEISVQLFVLCVVSFVSKIICCRARAIEKRQFFPILPLLSFITFHLARFSVCFVLMSMEMGKKSTFVCQFYLILSSFGRLSSLN